MLQAVAVLNSPSGGTVQVCTVYGSSYGAQQRAGYTLTYKPPTVASVASTAASAVTSDISSLFGGSSSSSSSSAMPLLLIGGIGLVAFLALR